MLAESFIKEGLIKLILRKIDRVVLNAYRGHHLNFVPHFLIFYIIT